MQTAIFFLLQCFYNYMSLAITQTRFMSRQEFSFYIVWSLVSIVMFPVLQATLTHNYNDLENIPELTYAGQLLILSTLSFRTHLKFRNLIDEIRFQRFERPQTAPPQAAPPGFVLAKLQYFQEMNKILLMSQFLTGASFAILTIGTLQAPAGDIAENKLASDILIGHTNFATAIAWMVTLLILYPRKGFVERPMVDDEPAVQEKGESRPPAARVARGVSVTHGWTDEEAYHLGTALLDEDEDDSGEHWHSRPITNPVDLPMVPFPHMSPHQEMFGEHNVSRNAEFVDRNSDEKAKSFVASASIASSSHSKRRSNTPKSVLSASHKTRDEDGAPLTSPASMYMDQGTPYAGTAMQSDMLGTSSPTHPASMQPAMISQRGPVSTTQADDAAEWMGIGLSMRRRMSNASIQTSSTITNLDEMLRQSKRSSDERLPTGATNRSSPPAALEPVQPKSNPSPPQLHTPLPPPSPTVSRYSNEGQDTVGPIASQRSYIDDGASSFNASAVYDKHSPRSRNSPPAPSKNVRDDVSVYSQSTAAPEPTLALQQRLKAAQHNRGMSIMSDTVSMYSQETFDVPEELGRQNAGYRHPNRPRSLSPPRRLSAISSMSGTSSDPASNAEIRTVISRTSNKAEEAPLSPSFIKGTLKFMPKGHGHGHGKQREQ